MRLDEDSHYYIDFESYFRLCCAVIVFLGHIYVLMMVISILFQGARKEAEKKDDENARNAQINT